MGLYRCRPDDQVTQACDCIIAKRLVGQAGGDAQPILPVILRILHNK